MTIAIVETIRGLIMNCIECNDENNLWECESCQIKVCSKCLFEKIKEDKSECPNCQHNEWRPMKVLG